MRAARLLVVSLAASAVAVVAACSSDLVGGPRSVTGGQASTAGAVASGADLQLTGSSNQGSPFVNTAFTYTYQIKNAGPDTAFGVVFVDTLLNGSTVTSAGTTTWACDISPTATSVRCDIGVLRKGDQVTIMMTVGAFAAGTLTNTGIVTSTVPDPQPANNAATVTVKVQSPTTGGGTKVTPIIISAFSSLPAVFQGGSYVVSGNSVAPGFQFTALQSGAWNGVFASIHGVGNGDCSLMADDAANPDNPGAFMGQTASNALPATGGTLTFFAAPKSLVPITLVAGQKYWLFCRGLNALGWAGWDFATDPTLRSLTASGSGTLAFLDPGILAQMPAFQVNVSQ